MKFVTVLLLISIPLNVFGGQLKDEYELKRKCGDEALQYFNSYHGEGDKKTEGDKPVPTYTNHYNKKFNTCYVLTVVMYPGRYSKELVDIHENKTIGIVNFP